MLSYRICMGCKHLITIPDMDKNGMAIGAFLSCEFDKEIYKEKCKLCNDGRSAWGSLFDDEEEN